MPRRQPRWPSMGLNSCSSSTARSSFAPCAICRLVLRLALRAQGGDLHHQLLALGQELVQRRVEGADGDRVPVHLLEEPGEVGALHGQQLLERARVVGDGLAVLLLDRGQLLA